MYGRSLYRDECNMRENEWNEAINEEKGVMSEAREMVGYHKWNNTKCLLDNKAEFFSAQK